MSGDDERMEQIYKQKYLKYKKKYLELKRLEQEQIGGNLPQGYVSLFVSPELGIKYKTDLDKIKNNRFTKSSYTSKEISERFAGCYYVKEGADEAVEISTGEELSMYQKAANMARARISSRGGSYVNRGDDDDLHTNGRDDDDLHTNSRDDDYLRNNIGNLIGGGPSPILLGFFYKKDDPTHKDQVITRLHQENNGKNFNYVIDMQLNPFGKNVTISDNLKTIPVENMSQSGSQPMAQSGSQPMAQSGSQPMARSVPQSGSQPMARSVPQSGSQPMARSVSQPVTQSVARSVARSVAQPVTQSVTRSGSPSGYTGRRWP